MLKLPERGYIRINIHDIWVTCILLCNRSSAVFLHNKISVITNSCAFTNQSTRNKKVTKFSGKKCRVGFFFWLAGYGVLWLFGVVSYCFVGVLFVGLFVWSFQLVFCFAFVFCFCRFFCCCCFILFCFVKKQNVCPYREVYQDYQYKSYLLFVSALVWDR